MLAKFSGLLTELIEQTLHIRPVETNLRRARTELVSLKQRRHRGRNAGQNRRRGLPCRIRTSTFACLPALLALPALQRFPVPLHFLRRVRFLVPKYMTMP